MYMFTIAQWNTVLCSIIFGYLLQLSGHIPRPPLRYGNETVHVCSPATLLNTYLLWVGRDADGGRGSGDSAGETLEQLL